MTMARVDTDLTYIVNKARTKVTVNPFSESNLKVMAKDLGLSGKKELFTEGANYLTVPDRMYFEIISLTDKTEDF